MLLTPKTTVGGERIQGRTRVFADEADVTDACLRIDTGAGVFVRSERRVENDALVTREVRPRSLAVAMQHPRFGPVDLMDPAAVHAAEHRQSLVDHGNRALRMLWGVRDLIAGARP